MVIHDALQVDVLNRKLNRSASRRKSDDRSGKIQGPPEDEFKDGLGTWVILHEQRHVE